MQWPCSMNAAVLPDSCLHELIAKGSIAAPTPIEGSQVQPNSIDLRLGATAHRTRCSFLPVGQPVETLLAELTTNVVSLDSPDGYVIEDGTTYVVPLMECVDLPPDVYGMANPKSSTGRLDIMARLLINDGHSFDVVPAGYRGPLFLEVIARSFPVRIRKGDTLAQLRLVRGVGSAAISDKELRSEIDKQFLIRTSDGTPVSANELECADGVVLSVDLGGEDRTVGYRSRKCPPVLDLRERGLPIKTYWERVYSPSRRSEPLILETNGFYIFASRERVVVPPDLCAEMVAIDVRSGELRTHYAGFFDSGFGVGCNGARVVLEVRNMDVPFRVQHGQRLFRLRFFRNLQRPESLYGQGIRSNYQGQGLRLAKQFAQDVLEQPQLELPWSSSEGDSVTRPPKAPDTQSRPVENRTTGALGVGTEET